MSFTISIEEAAIDILLESTFQVLLSFLIALDLERKWALFLR